MLERQGTGDSRFPFWKEARKFGIPGFFWFSEIEVGQSDRIPPPPKKKRRDCWKSRLSFYHFNNWTTMIFDAVWCHLGISWSQEAAAVDLYCNWVDVGPCSDRIDLQAKQKQHSRSLLVQCMGKVWSLGNTRIGVFPACLCFSSFTHWRYAGYELEWEELIKVADWEWLLGVRLQRSQFSTSAR